MGSEVETVVGKFWQDDDGIVRCIASPLHQTAEHAQDAMRVFAQLGGGKKRPVVIDTSRVKALSREARAMYSGDEAAALWSACALVVSTSSIARTIGNFVMTVSPPKFPTKMFNNLEEALVWARGHLNEGSRNA